ncbi:hypothetical protein QZH41_002905 [Actinostola sp. cb2023]|nr:hypothetical protein QZH41_002905 [Actinostola sp. cb2023]
MKNNASNETLVYHGGATNAEKIFATTAYTIIFPIALVGNFLAIYIVFRKRYMRSVTNMLLVNMFVGNFLVAFVAMPYSVAYIYLRNPWFEGVVGSLTCKLIHFAYVLPIAASIFALLLSSIDRYFAVIYPFKQLQFICNARASTIFIWLSSSICMSPYLYMFTSTLMKDGNYYCIIDWSPLDTVKSSKIFYLTIFFLLYIIPLLVIASLYLMIGLKLWNRKIPGNVLVNVTRAADKAKKKVVKMLLIVVVVFAVSWIPAHTMHMMIYFNAELYRQIPRLVSIMAFWTCHANSAISPFLFLFMSEKFRSELLAIFKERSASEKASVMRRTYNYKITSISRNNSASKSSSRSSAKKEYETTTL